ncbi:MAG: DUF4846 domain-containing protein [Eubacteriales bacterium]|nr:DUF4846 domain-containing protein [Eubacteriales bacterium]
MIIIVVCMSFTVCALSGCATSKTSFVNPEGMSLEKRLKTPEGYGRDKTSDFGKFIRQYPMKKDGASVLLHNGKKKNNQDAHIAVFDMNLGEQNLQQCADSIIRLYAEFLYNSNQRDKIGFHFVNGFYADYDNWRKGKRIAINGNNVSWISSKGYDDSNETFEKYLEVVFTYASTISLKEESKPVLLENAEIGDCFLHAGSPGHVVMIVDICINDKGKKAYLLAQGYMPAQEFHLLKNPAHKSDPWYYEDEIVYPLKTPEYTFKKGSLRHPNYLE